VPKSIIHICRGRPTPQAWPALVWGVKLGDSFEQLPQVFASLRELVSEGGEQLMGFGRIVTIPFQLRDTKFLLGHAKIYAVTTLRSWTNASRN
jgi:hypothetical protein